MFKLKGIFDSEVKRVEANDSEYCCESKSVQ